jgi:hypothetical protein
VEEFYPNEGYAKKNWKPERMDNGIVQQAALADAIRVARENGYDISDEDAKLLLQNSLVENRVDYGVNPVTMFRGSDEGKNYADYPKNTQEIMMKLGLDPLSNPSVTVQNSPTISALEFNPMGVRSQKNMTGVVDGYAQQDAAQSYLLRAILKQREVGAKSLADLFNGTRWNGKGKAKFMGVVSADADNHSRKVKAMDNPLNKRLFDTYKQQLDKGGYDVYYDARDLQNKQHEESSVDSIISDLKSRFAF